jgi:glyoxylase-like metal-dependent hydrolase (beta-lactamase superfamily II)
MTRKGVLLAILFFLSWAFSWSIAARADDDRDEHKNGASAATIAARQRFFGAENVDARGNVRRDRVILSWITNAGLAASFEGRVVLLDTYINRFEVPPSAGPDLRRTSFGAQDLIALKPEAIFLGHGHGDHADNAAYIAKWLNIPIYSTPETAASRGSKSFTTGTTFAAVPQNAGSVGTVPEWMCLKALDWRCPAGVEQR